MAHVSVSEMDSNIMIDHERVRSLYDYDYVSWYIYLEDYKVNARVLMYYDFNGIFLIYNGADQIVRTRSLSLPWMSWS